MSASLGRAKAVLAVLLESGPPIGTQDRDEDEEQEHRGGQARGASAEVCSAGGRQEGALRSEPVDQYQ